MGLLGRNGKKDGKHAGTTIIAAGTRLVGDLALSEHEKLHIDGQMQGNIRCDASVTIGREGRFEGEIRADRVLVSGHVEGKIDAGRLEIVAHGVVDGEVDAADFVVESGGQFSGTRRIKDEQPRQLSHQPAGPDSENEGVKPTPAEPVSP